MPRARHRRRRAIAGAKCSARTGSARGDHRDAGDLAHQADELQVEPFACAVGIDRVHEQLSGAALDRLARPHERVEGRLGAASVGRDDEPDSVWADRLTSSESTSTWAPKRSAISSTSSGRAIAAEFTPILSAPTASSRATSSGGAHPAADGERDEHLFCGAPHDVVGRRPLVDRRGHVEECQLVGALREVQPARARRGRPCRAGSPVGLPGLHARHGFPDTDRSEAKGTGPPRPERPGPAIARASPDGGRTRGARRRSIAGARRRHRVGCGKRRRGAGRRAPGNAACRPPAQWRLAVRSVLFLPPFPPRRRRRAGPPVRASRPQPLSVGDSLEICVEQEDA